MGMKIKKLMAVSILFLCLFSVRAEAFSVGAGGDFEYSPYRNESYNFYPLPIIKYDSDYLYINTPYAGVHIIRKDGFELNAQAEYTTLSFKADKHKSNMSLLEDRDAAVTTGVESVIWGKYGLVKLNLSSDVMGNSGLRGKVSYGGVKEVGTHFMLLPSAGCIWYSQKHNRYFFGVSEEESYKTGFSSFSPQASFVPFISLAAMLPVNERVSFTIMTEYRMLLSEIKDSPIVDKNKGITFYINFTYKL